ncbi:hypothetical protein [Bradyrhizobium sp. BR 1433]|uniref:hypothetical protein n=1 Tax=Bradyrhizobium sp. BR 1433 TaxID=3447967 RepID=UPI003EE5278B
MSSLVPDGDDDPAEPRNAPAAHLRTDRTLLNAALNEIERTSHISDFSTTVVKHGKKLQIVADRAMFLQRAAADFQLRFVASFEDNIRAGKSWGYATTCNVVSREAAGQPGIEVCKAIADRVSRLDDDLIGKVQCNTLSLLASSFGRYSAMADCRNGTIRIAAFCLGKSGVVQRLNSQHVSLLVNAFGKWPEEPNVRQCRGRNRG